MNKQTRILSSLSFSAILALTLASSASAVDLSKLPAAAKKENVTFDKDIKPLFEASCVRCHGAERPKGGIRLNTLEGVLKGGKEGKIVEVGNSEKSELVISVSQLDPETAMPPKPRARKGGPGGQGGPGGPGGPGGAGAGAPGGPENHGAQGGQPGGPNKGNQPPPKPLTAEEVGLVRAWIDQGAK
ncbi:MAG: c-type cytochrome domain-containing protein [Verrucomicrobiota bacterium]